MKTPIVLVGFAEALSAPEATWSLVDSGFEVLAFGRKGRKCALRQSRYTNVIEVTAPETDIRQSLQEICEIAKEAKGKSDRSGVVFLPLDDAALWLSTKTSAKDSFAVASSPESRLGLDKAFQVESARKAGLNVPETYVVATAQELSVSSNRLPLILRSAVAAIERNGRLEKGSNWICATAAELRRAVEQWGEKFPLLVQPFLRGIGEGVFGFATPQGVTAWSAHRRLRMMNPHGSGSSACISQPVPQGLKAAVERLVMEAGWRGLFMVELLRDSAGTRWFVEFNGRTWGSLALSRRQGLEYPAWTVSQSMDSSWRPQYEAQSNRELVCRNLGRELMHLMFVLRGRRSEGLDDWPSFWRSVLAVLGIRPGDSLYNFRRDDLKVFGSDIICTVRDQCFKQRKRV